MQASDSKGCQKGCQSSVSPMITMDDSALLRRRQGVRGVWAALGVGVWRLVVMRRPAPCHAGGGRPGLPSGWRPRRGDTYLPLKNPGAFSMRGISVLGVGRGSGMGLWLHCGLVAAFYGVLVSQYAGLPGGGAVGGCIGFLDGGQGCTRIGRF